MTAIADLNASVGLPARVASLRFDATVPRRLVHRASIAETFLTDAAEVGQDRFLVAAQLPRSHSMYNDGTGRYHDLLLLAEVVRQAGTLLSHRFYGVPEGSVFPLRRAQIEITELDATARSDAASETVADVRISDHERQAGQLSSMSLNADLIIDGQRAGSASGAMHFVSRSSYDTLRRDRPPSDSDASPAAVARAEARRVGRCDARNVVVGELQRAGQAGHSCRVVADTRHPSFFDHPQDHLPGMLLLEAFRQTALLAVADACAWAPDSLVVVACDAKFARYAELDLEANCSASVGEPRLPRRGEPWVPVSLRVTQQGATLCDAVVRVADAHR